MARITKTEISRVASAMGRKAWRVRLEVQGIEEIRRVARENGKLGGRPPKDGRKEKANARQAASH